MRQRIYKQNDEVFDLPKEKREFVEYYYAPEKRFFSIRALKRRGEWTEGDKAIIPDIAVYSFDGILEGTLGQLESISSKAVRSRIRTAARAEKSYKNKYYRFYEDEPPEEIDVPLICIVDGIPFNSFTDAGMYLGVSKQAVHQARQRKAKKIAGKDITWID